MQEKSLVSKVSFQLGELSMTYNTELCHTSVNHVTKSDIAFMQYLLETISELSVWDYEGSFDARPGRS